MVSESGTLIYYWLLYLCILYGIFKVAKVLPTISWRYQNNRPDRYKGNTMINLVIFFIFLFLLLHHSWFTWIKLSSLNFKSRHIVVLTKPTYCKITVSEQTSKWSRIPQKQTHAGWLVSSYSKHSTTLINGYENNSFQCRKRWWDY